MEGAHPFIGAEQALVGRRPEHQGTSGAIAVNHHVDHVVEVPAAAVHACGSRRDMNGIKPCGAWASAAATRKCAPLLALGRRNWLATRTVQQDDEMRRLSPVRAWDEVDPGSHRDAESKQSGSNPPQPSAHQIEMYRNIATAHAT